MLSARWLLVAVPLFRACLSFRRLCWFWGDDCAVAVPPHQVTHCGFSASTFSWHAMKNQETRRVDYCEILALFLFSFYCSPNNMHSTRVCSQHRSQVQQSRSWTSVTSSYELLKVYIKYVLGREGFRPRAAASDFVLSAKVKLWQVKCTGSV